MKLICDHMLGSLAKWLRIFGFDTIYPDATTTDDSILQRANDEDRLLISRDKQLIQRGKKAQIPILEIQTTKLTEQLTQVLSRVPVDEKIILSRCTLCNTQLCPIEKKGLDHCVPEKVFKTRDEFWYCPTCKKYYWMGTHYENMREKINVLLSKDSS
jgi:uncharacterized protein with PIN domain